MSKLQRFVPIASLLATTLACLPTQAPASGFAVPEISILGLGTSNALVANHLELGAIAYNPAASVFHPGTTLSGGLMLVYPNLRVTTSTGRHDSQGLEKVLIPMFQATYQLNDRVTLGLGANAPFGLETVWDANKPVFPTFSDVGTTISNPALGFLHPTKSKIAVLAISPTVAFRLSDQAAIAVGADYYDVRAVNFSSLGGTNCCGDGDAWGWNASLIYATGKWSFGLAYHADVTADIKGNSSSILGGSAPATAEVPLPWRLQGGVRYQATEQLGIEFDITRTGWSKFDVLTIQGVTTTRSTNNWDDATAYRFGVTYDLRPGTQLRFGYSLDETPQPDRYFSARVPDADRHLFSIGVGHDLGSGLILEAGYMYVHFEERTVTGASYLAQVVGSGGMNLEPNGTDAYAGEYKSHVHLFGVGLAKRFH